MVRNGRVLGVGGRIALALLAGGLSSCVLIQKPYSSVRPLSAPPQTLGAILPQLEARWPEPRTFQGQGELIVSGEGIRGKDVVDGNLLYSAPDRLRFRASRLPVGTVFEILQTGGRVSIKLNREGKVFEGSAAELASHPELIGGVEPLEVVRAFLIGRSFLDAVKEEQARGADPGSLAFQGDALTVRAVREGTPTRAPRMEEYVVRRKDGLIQAARLFEPDGEGQWRLALTVSYERWDGEAAHPYPRRLEIRAERPRTVLKINVDTVRIDPPLTPKVFQMDTEGAQVRPLAELFEPTP